MTVGAGVVAGTGGDACVALVEARHRQRGRRKRPHPSRPPPPPLQTAIQVCVKYDPAGFELTALLGAITKRFEYRKGVLA
jgi:hypothetical protein